MIAAAATVSTPAMVNVSYVCRSVESAKRVCGGVVMWGPVVSNVKQSQKEPQFVTKKRKRGPNGDINFLEYPEVVPHCMLEEKGVLKRSAVTCADVRVINRGEGFHVVEYREEGSDIVRTGSMADFPSSFVFPTRDVAPVIGVWNGSMPEVGCAYSTIAVDGVVNVNVPGSLALVQTDMVAIHRVTGEIEVFDRYNTNHVQLGMVAGVSSPIKNVNNASGMPVLYGYVSVPIQLKLHDVYHPPQVSDTVLEYAQHMMEHAPPTHEDHLEEKLAAKLTELDFSIGKAMLKKLKDAVATHDGPYYARRLLETDALAIMQGLANLSKDNVEVLIDKALEMVFRCSPAMQADDILPRLASLPYPWQNNMDDISSRVLEDADVCILCTIALNLWMLSSFEIDEEV